MKKIVLLSQILLLAARSLPAQITPPLHEPLNGGGRPEGADFLYTSSNQGRITVSPGVSGTVPSGGPFTTTNNGNRFRGNVIAATSDTHLLAHDLFLTRSVAQTVRFMVYEATVQTGPYTRVSDVPVAVQAGSGFVGSGDILVPVRNGRFYLIGASWDASNIYAYTTNNENTAIDFGTAVSGYSFNSGAPGETINTLSASILRYHQRLRSGPPVSEAVPSAGTFISTSQPNYFRGNIYQVTQDTVLESHELWLQRDDAREIRFMVYEGGSANGTFTRISDVTVQAEAGTGFVTSGFLGLTLSAGNYYVFGAYWAVSTGYEYVNNAFPNNDPQTVDFGLVTHGKLFNALPGASFVNTSGTTTTGYRQRVNTAPPGALRMDAAVAGAASTNVFDIALDLSAVSNAVLRFEHRSFNETASSDGVYLFNNLLDSVQLVNLPAGTTGWQSFEADLMAAATGQGWDLTLPVYLVFQQNGDNAWPAMGREFRNLRVDVPPDLIALSLQAPATPLTFRGFSSAKNIPLTGVANYVGGNEDVTGISFTIRYSLDLNPGSFSQDVPVTLDLPAGAEEEVNLNHTLAVPGTTPLPLFAYGVSVNLDADGEVEEASESNNTAMSFFIVNHYSGILRFGDVETQIYLSSWSAREFMSSTLHRISGSGWVNGRFFTFTDLDVVKDLNTLDYSMDPGGNQEILLAPLAERTENGVRYRSSGNMVLSKNGLHADIVVTLPAGFGWASASDRKDLNARVMFQNTSLNGTFGVSGPVTSFGVAWYAEETKPLMLEANSLTWTPATGTFTLNATGGLAYVRGAELSELELAVDNLWIPAGEEIRRSNEQYYRFANIAANQTVTLKTGTGGEAMLSAEFGVSPGSFRTHLPYDTNPAWNAAGLLTVINDSLAAGSVLPEHEPLTLSYDQTCPDDCGDPEMLASLTLVNPEGDFVLNAEGGFVAEGALQVPSQLAWGALPPGMGLPPYAQTTGTVDAAKYLASGHFFKGNGTVPALPHQRAGSVLHAGAGWDNPQGMERPGTPAYAAGLGIYPGLNFRQAEHPGLTATNVLGGKSFGPFSLSARSKYYVRRSGVTGIHEAAAFNTTGSIYDYSFHFTNLGFSYLSSSPVPDGSRTNGSLTLPYPTDDTVPFERMTITCKGELQEMDPVEGQESLAFSYWAVDLFLQRLDFRRSNGCAVGAGTLVATGRTQIGIIPSPMFGEIALGANGHILPATANDVGVDSRFTVPNVIEVAGRNEQVYNFQTVHKAYLNDYASTPTHAEPNQGYFSLAGHLTVPFFTALQTHLHFGSGEDAVVYMAGGWPAQGWKDGENDFFNRPGFDPGHTGRPAPVPLDDYRSNQIAAYRPLAVKHVAGITDVSYPLLWDTNNRSFASHAAVKNDWLALNVESQIDRMDAETASISFGLQYDGLPRLNLTDYVLDSLSWHLGSLEGEVLEGIDAIMRQVNRGMKSFDRILKRGTGNLTEFVIKDFVDPILGELYDDLKDAYEEGEDYAFLIDHLILRRFVGHEAGDYYTVTLRQRFEYIFEGFDVHLGLFDRIVEELDVIIGSLNMFLPTYTGFNAEGFEEELEGLLYQDANGNYSLLEILAKELLVVFGTEIAGAVVASIDEDLRAAFDAATLPITAVIEVIAEVRDELVLLRDSLAIPEAEFRMELMAMLVFEGEEVDEIGAIVTETGDAIIAWLRSLPPDRNPFIDMDREEFVNLFREEIKIVFMDCAFQKALMSKLRARVYDVEGRARGAVNSLFSAVNKSLRDALSGALSRIDDEVNELVGPLGQFMGAGQIDGYAQIRGLSLDRLRLDGKFEWKVPDPLQFQGFFQIETLGGAGNSICDVGIGMGPARKVTIGAMELPCSWMGDDIRVNVITHFSFSTPAGVPFPVPVGMGGGFDLSKNSAPITFEAFELPELGARVAFGTTEAYLAAQARAKFQSAEVAAGIFFGATCDLEPLLMVDPDVGDLLGTPPLVGAFVYGEGWIPILEYGCALNVSAGVGVGFFFFSDAGSPNTYGMKMLLGAKGEAICALNIHGEVRMVGLRRAGKYVARGNAMLTGSLGSCPWCIRHKIRVDVTYDDGDITVTY